MTGNDCSNSAKVELLGCHLEEIATACGVLKKAGYQLRGDEQEVIGTLVTSLAEQMGWRADACLAMLNQEQCVGGWEDWVSSPSETAIREKLAGKEVHHG